MTPRAWASALLFAGILWAALIVALWLLLAAQTVGVEAWHDSAVPQSAFTPVVAAPATVSPSLRAVPSLAAVRPRAAASPDLTKDARPESMTGISSWYRYVPGGAAAGPRLRSALGPDWRGSVVLVDGIPVTLSDWCGCPGGRVIDLDSRTFAALAPLSQGLTEVTISWTSR